MTGALEEAAKATGGLIDAMRSNPLAIANILLNICFLVFLIYYVSIIAQRAQTVVNSLFAANDKLYTQWGVVIKDQNALTEKAMHCILPSDALQLLQAPRYAPPPPAEPQRPQAPRGDLNVDPPKPPPVSDPGKRADEEPEKPIPTHDEHGNAPLE
jgi:hypothetical protein